MSMKAGKEDLLKEKDGEGSDMAQSNGGETLVAKYTRIVTVVAAYWVVSISMVFINKHLLSSSEVKLNAPLFITFFQCLIALLICLILSYLSKIFPSSFKFPSLKIEFSTLIKILPLSLVFVCMITFNNLCLKYVGVAFYYVGRSLTTVFNVALTYFVLRKATSVQAILCCAIILVGFFMGVDQESVAGSLSVMGVVFGVLASLCVSLNSIFTEKVLPDVKGDIWLLQFNNNINACILFFPLMLVFGEIPVIYHYEHLTSVNFWLMMLIGGIFGFGIGYLTTLQIKVTSPLTHNISGTAKACTQTVLAVVWFQEIKSLLWWVSNGIVLFGSAAYTRVRQQEMLQQHNREMTKDKLSNIGIRK